MARSKFGLLFGEVDARNEYQRRVIVIPPALNRRLKGEAARRDGV